MGLSRRSRMVLLALILPQLTWPAGMARAGIFGEKRGAADGPITLQQAAAYVDAIDRRLFDAGTVGVKVPDVWGQNRMTVYRAEFESQLAKRLGNYQDILQAAQSRTDVAALTSATSLGATVAATQSSKSSPLAAFFPSSFNYSMAPNPAYSGVYPAGTLMVNASATPTASLTPPAPAAATAAAPTPADPGNPGFADMAAQLAAIAARIDKLKEGALTLPMGINNYVNKEGKTGVGIEPTIQLDEEADYVNHLHQLRRINAGDDLTDMAGYGLYLIRMPVSLMPGPQSRKGKGASVTVEARHELTPDLLPNTFRDVAILDLCYALTQVVNDDIHEDIHDACYPTPPNAKKVEAKQEQQFDPSKIISGPTPSLLLDLRQILGPIDPPTDDDLRKEEERQKGTPGEHAAPAPAATGSVFRLDQVPPGPAGPAEAPANPPVPMAPALLPPTRGAFRPKPAYRELAAKRDQVARTQFNPLDTFPNMEVARRYQTILSDRLDLLVESMKESQEDPYRHDPSTLDMFQAALMDVYRYMRENSGQVDLFQVPKIEALAERLLRRDYRQLRIDREQFLRDLYCIRHGKAPGSLLDWTWSNEVEPSDVLAFALLIQFIQVDRLLKWDMHYMSQRRGCNCGDVGGLFFYEFEPSPEARHAFNEYVACKWPLKIYSVDPVLDQQNVLDAYSRRTELQLALAVGVATGQFNIKNATSFARQLDLDLQTVGLNRTSVGFGAGETTFGWMFYPRVQTPHPVSNFRTFTNVLTGTGQGTNADLRGRRIEPGQRECIALMVTPNFIPSIRISTVTNWFDITGMHARPRIANQEMIALGRTLQMAKDAVTRACDSGQYRPTDFVVLNQRIKQLEALLPTQDVRVDLPDEGDLLGSEIFSTNAAGLAPTLLAWYGEPIQDGKAGSIFLMGRGFSVSETQVVVGGMPLHKNSEFRLISRNVMQIIVPANARSSKVGRDQEPEPAQSPPKVAAASLVGSNFSVKGGTVDIQQPGGRFQAKLDPKLNPDVDLTVNDGVNSLVVKGANADVQVNNVHVRVQGTPAAKPKMKPCDRAVIDVHIATPNGISNHLYVEVVPKTDPDPPKNAVTKATTKTTVRGNTTTTTTTFETTPPGTVLPPLTILPLGTPWPPNTMLAPGSVTGSPTGSLMPGLVPTAATPAAMPLTLSPSATTATPASPAASLTPMSTPSQPTPPASAPTAAPAATPSNITAPTASPKPSASLDLPPLPPEPTEVAEAPAPRRNRPSILRRIGLPDR